MNFRNLILHQSSGFVLFFILTFLGSTSAQDSLPSQQLATFEFVENKIYQANNISISNRDFKRLAASFDDPSRILLHYAGFTNANDQANGIVYHGLPSHFSSWQLNGLDVVNTNHLSNAGTFSDLSSLSAGGVNMFSGNIINNYQYHTSINNNKKGMGLAGISNMVIDSLQKNYVQASLLGLESGVDLKKNKHQILLNFRYSFTGLLGQLGVNFGNEAISFYDGLAKYSYTAKKTKLSLLYTRGVSANYLSKNHDSLNVFKDYFTIDYQSKIDIAQFQLQHAFNPKTNIHFGLSYSTKSDLRNANANLNSILINVDTVYNLYKNNSSKLTFKAGANLEELFDAGIKLFLDENGVSNVSLQQLNFFHDNTNWSLLPYIERKFEHNNFSAELQAAGIIDETFYFTPTVNINYKLTTKNTFNLGFSRSAQLVNVFDNTDNMYTTAFNTTANYIFSTNKLKLEVGVFSHVIQNVPVSYDFYSTFNQFDDLYINNLIDYGSARSKGFVLNVDKSFSNSLWLNGNITIFDSEFSNDDLDWFSASNNFKTLYNINAGKIFSTKKGKLTLSASFHFRGGAYQYIPENFYVIEYNYNLPPVLQLGSYRRLDFRINYETGRTFWSLDIQNILNILNDGYQYYDINGLTTQKQLGLFPNLTYKYSF